ncbi:MAG: hypothetical protein NTV84_03045 [Methanoregula sp.]|nr:hypothetical protein [Methanoregula sp.]
MERNSDIPELLEKYMADSGKTEQWITVQDIRTCFHLDASRGPAISGFLFRLNHSSFFYCRYKVTRIEKYREPVAPYRLIKRYLVQKRPVQKNHEHSAPVRVYETHLIKI